MEDLDLTGTAGTPQPEPETTGTPAEGTTGTLEPEGTTGTPAPAEQPRYRVRDREYTAEELQQQAERAFGLERAAEERNRELERAREEREFYRRQALGEVDEPIDTGIRLPNRNGYGRGSAEIAPQYTDEDTGNGVLDPNDPRDRITIDTRARQRQWQAQQQLAATQARIAQVLQNQHDAMAANAERYPGYDRDRAIAIISDGIKQGKRMDLFDAYDIDRGRRAPELAAEAAKRAADDEAKRAAGDNARNARVLPVATAGSGEPAKPTNFHSADAVRDMPLAQYAKLKKEGWVPDPRGSGGLVRRAS